MASAVRQFLSYAIVGVVSNLVGYFLYLILTGFLWGPKLTMVALYFTGALVGFWGNRRYTFRHDGRLLAAGVRYIFTHIAGCSLNFLILLLFVDYFGFPHQFVQAGAVVVVAAFLFILFKFFVFSEKALKEGGL